MTRRCSHCSNNGHNSRTCPSRGDGASASDAGVKLFGVRLTDGSIMKKSASMGNLSALYHSSSATAASPNPSSPAAADPVEGYLSDDPAHASCSAKRRADRKKGTPWTEEEHRLFLLGLQKLGKGDWRGIARNFVLSRTPTQVASHAQKHFIRQCSVSRRKRRSSLFDMAPEMTAAEAPVQTEDQFMLPPQAVGTAHCSLKLSLKPDSDQSMEDAAPTEPKEDVKTEAPTIVTQLPPIIPAFYPAAAYVPVSFPLWPEVNNKGGGVSQHQVLKPIPVVSKEAMNVDELVGKLSLKETDLSLKLLGEPSRQSAFHASTPTDVNKGIKY